MWHPNFPQQAQASYSVDPKIIPATLTAETTVDTWVFQIDMSNSTGTAATITIQDAQGTPMKLFEAVSVPANGAVVYTNQFGRKFTGGIKWQSGTASALHGAIWATIKVS